MARTVRYGPGGWAKLYLLRSVVTPLEKLLGTSFHHDQRDTSHGRMGFLVPWWVFELYRAMDNEAGARGLKYLDADDTMKWRAIIRYLREHRDQLARIQLGEPVPPVALQVLRHHLHRTGKRLPAKTKAWKAVEAKWAP